MAAGCKKIKVRATKKLAKISKICGVKIFGLCSVNRFTARLGIDECCSGDLHSRLLLNLRKRRDDRESRRKTARHRDHRRQMQINALPLRRRSP
jgi:hypothetical protein